jgi:hypothetical protein
MEKCALLSQQWAQNTAVVIDIDKTEVILLSRRKRLNQAFNTGIQVAPGVIKSFNQHATRWLGIWLDRHLTLKEHHNKMISKAYRAEARVRSPRGKFGLSPENIRTIQVAAVQAVGLYGAELWWDEINIGRTTDLQELVNGQSRSITGLLRTTPIRPLVKEAGVRSADSLLANRRRRYATRAFELPEGNPISDGIRNPVDDVSLFGRLSKCCRQDIQPQFSGQDMVESTYIPASTERIAAPVIIESRQQAEHTELSMSPARTKCLWTDGSHDDLGNVGAAVDWTEVDEWTGLKYRLGRNKEVFDAELFAILQASVLIRDEGAIMIGEGIQKISIFTDSQAALNRIQHDGIGPGQTWASAIIRDTDEICRLNIQVEFQDMQRLKAMKLATNLQRMRRNHRMKKSYRRRRIDVHL